MDWLSLVLDGRATAREGTRSGTSAAAWHGHDTRARGGGLAVVNEQGPGAVGLGGERRGARAPAPGQGHAACGAGRQPGGPPEAYG